MVGDTCAAVAAGSRVRVGIQGEEPQWYSLVPADGETDPARNRISVDSPLGRALLGGQRGATVSVRAPHRTYPATILYVDD
ncbi:MAG TPA: GreA/GreB family elongation factor [Myxococcaceae bacterium]|nr:GreA/GreB family elongation factor [Myxococcaceae bacterium]